LENFEKTIEEVRLREDVDALWKVCCDILRALTIFGGSAWHADLLNTLIEIWNTREMKGEEVNSLQAQIVNALNLLNERGVITSETRLKADLLRPSPTKEFLHTAKEYFVLLKMFGSDREVFRYKHKSFPS
jgi:hypothetical protein